MSPRPVYGLPRARRLSNFKDPPNVPAAPSFAEGMQQDIVLAKQHLQTA